MSSMSATELSRLRRQRRLECSSPIHRIPPANIKRRSRRGPVSDGHAANDTGSVLNNATHFFDEEGMASGMSLHSETSPATMSRPNHNRSISLSSLSVPCSADTEELKSPAPQPAVNAVTPPESPRHRSKSVTPGVHRTKSPCRLPSPTPLPVPFLDNQTPRRSPNRPLSASNSSRFVANDGEMPMDEFMSSGIPPRNNKKVETVPLALPPTPTTTSTALVVAGASMLNRMTNALQLQMRPAHMNADEERLWDAIQDLVQNSSSANPNTSSDAEYWAQKYEQREAEWAEQQQEHDRALRAIQRVLADVTTEREQEVTRLKEELERSHQQRDDTILKLTQKLKELQQQVNDAKGGREVVENKDDAEPNQGTPSPYNSMELVKALKSENEKQEQRIDELEANIRALQETSTEVKVDTIQEKLRKELEEKCSALENAKKIIASLESANSNLSRELRAKLKEKEDELATLTSTSADRKRTLDSLATELRELQRQQQKPRLSPQQVANQRALCQMLEKNVKALRQAAVQHEAQNNQSSVDQISHIVSETFTSLKQNLESWESYLRNEAPGAMDMNYSYTTLGDTTLFKKNEEITKIKKEFEKLKVDSDKETTRLKTELASVKEQLAKNMEILAQKGRELSVLKDSLNLEDNGVGYISDDATDGEDNEADPDSSRVIYSGPGATAFNGSLLVHGGPGVHSVNPNAAELSDATAAEIQMLKNELIKQQKEREAKAAELQAERESLANAKMIISSLEKANKSMLEDLRSRLQDSNTAIASLLEKSIEHEKTITMLRKELEKCRHENDKEQQKAAAQMAKLREENLVFSMRLAAKDSELEELQNALSQYEGQELHISKLRMSSVEEKKDDPVSDDENS